MTCAGKFTDEQVKNDKRFSLLGPMSASVGHDRDR